MKLRKRFALALAFAGVLAAAGITAGAEDTIGQGVYIGDIDVSGMDYAQADALVRQRVEQARSELITVRVGEDSIQVTASELGLHWNNKNVVRQALSLGNSGNLIKRYKDIKDLEQDSHMLTLQFSANENAVREFIESDCMQFEKEAQEASISSDGGAGFNLVEGVTGQVINVDESVKAVQEYIANEWQGGSAGEVNLAVQLDEPKGDMKDLETIQDCLGTFTTYYGSTTGRNTNVERGAELINDHVIWPGETFSVCDHLVPFNAENGYELGGAYESGRVVQEYGGGICQVSTTLYNALLLAEVEIVERHNHTMSVNYVQPSADAAIAEGVMDLVFRNNYDTPIFISGYGWGGELTFSVWGQETRPADREVYYEGVVTSQSTAPGTVLYAAPEQPVGYFYQVQSAMGGMTAELWKYVTYNGETTSELVNSSTYQATPTSYEVGTAGASDALLNAIYANDLAAAQAAALGVSTTPQTDASVTIQTETPQTDAPQTEVPQTDPIYTDPSTGGGDVYEDPSTGGGDIYEDPSTGGGSDIYEDPSTGGGDVYEDPSAGGGSDIYEDPGVVVW